MRNQFFTIIATLLFGFFSVNAQNPDGNNFNSYYTDHFANIVPPTPNAANFMQYGNSSVSTSIGRPDISIPLFTIEEDGVQVPISISYDASGVKVRDMSSTVGLKWTLNAGGMVSRTINDLDDFTSSNGWVRNQSLNFYEDWRSQHSNYDYSNNSQQLQLSNYISAKDDFPDNFNYRFLGYSGSFVYSSNGDVIRGQKDNIVVENHTSITDFFGNTYNFGSAEINKSYIYFSEDHIVLSNIEREENVDVGWMLANITTKNQKNINFTYIPYEYPYVTQIASQRLVTRPNCDYCEFYPLGCEGQGSPSYKDETLKETKVSNISTNQLIEKIYTENVEVRFIYQEGAVNGISVDGWDRRIDKIIIKDKLKGKEKSFLFTYGTFDGDKRLKLLKVQEKGFDNSLKPPYIFNYNDQGLPGPDSFAQDYMGYYNGFADNVSFLPKSEFTLTRTRPHGGSIVVHPGYQLLSNRYFNEDFLYSGILDEITYPTGGRTEFTYDVNAMGENLGEPIILEKDDNITNFDNGNVRIYGDGTNFSYFGYNKYIYSTLIEINDVVGRFITQNLEDCVDCIFCEQGCLEQPKLHIYKYNGNVTDSPDDYFNPGKIGVTPVFEKTLTTNNAEDNSFDTSEGNGTYIVMLLLGGRNMGTSEYNPEVHNVNVWLKWNEKERDSNGNIALQENYFGGVRIKEIKDYNSDNEIFNLRKYNYKKYYVPEKNVFNSHDNFWAINNQEIFSSDKISKPGEQNVHGYLYTEIETVHGNNGIFGKTLEYYEPNIELYNVNGGSLIKETALNKNNEKVVENETLFTTTEINSIEFLIPPSMDNVYIDYVSCPTPENPLNHREKPTGGYSHEEISMIYKERKKTMDSTMTTQFLTIDNELKPVTTVKKYIYKTNSLLVEKEAIDTRFTATVDANGEITGYVQNNPEGEVVETEYQYVYEFKPTIPWTVPDGLPISKEVTNGSTKILGQYFQYDDDGNIMNTYRYNKGGGSHNGPTYVPPNYELDVAYLTEQGKPTQVIGQNGVFTSYIWGYNKQYPVAKIVGLPYAQVINTPDLNLTIISDPSTDDALRIEIDKVRQHFPDAQVTTYTYNTMVGVSSITDPKGVRVDYIYDDLGRLEYVRDQENNILGKNEYHYKTN